MSVLARRPSCQGRAARASHPVFAWAARAGAPAGPSGQPQASSSAPAAASTRAPAGQLSRRDLFALAGGVALLGGLPGGSLLGPGRALAAGPVLPSPEVKAAIDKAMAKAIQKGKCPTALRLVFHDAGTFSAAARDGGVNASIQYELDRPENFGLKRGWRLIEQMRDDLKGTPAEGVVSEADLIALAGAFAVRLCGGPDIAVPIGRPVAAAGGADPAGRMPSEKAGAEELKANFAAKGFTVQELVVLSGAHTLGSKGFGDATTFDNEYFRALLRKPWLDPKEPMREMIGLPSDHVLPEDPDCLPYIKTYAEDQAAFFRDFSVAYVKMCSLGVPGWA